MVFQFCSVEVIQVHAGITIWWSGMEQGLYFETVPGNLLIIVSMFLVKDQGLAYNETGEICCKH